MDRPPQRVVDFVTRGYAYVIVDVRGSGASFGSRRGELVPLEARDGKDVVDWIVSHPWSDGKVGATGVSYVGTTAELLLVNRHPAVKAIVPQFSLFDGYPDIFFSGGVPHTWFIENWAQAIIAMDRNEIPEQQRKQIVGVRPVDEDSDGCYSVKQSASTQQTLTYTLSLRLSHIGRPGSSWVDARRDQPKIVCA